MRFITKKMFDRLAAQKEEANTLKLTKLANHLDSHVLNKSAEVRSNDESYLYTQGQMRTDVEGALWDATIRVADYFGLPFDALQAQQMIEKIADDLIDEMRVAVGNDSGVGPYDAKTPGETSEHVAFEVEASDD